MTSGNAYGEKLVNLMLKREQVFIQFRPCYYLLYQCLVPNTREVLSLLVQHYSVPKDFERIILSGGNPRVCNQGILNFLLIKLRTDKNFAKFWKVVKTMIKEPVLRHAVEHVQRGIHHPSIASIRSITRHHDTTISNDSVFPIDERALSVTGSDDDYCISYNVTIVDVRSCARPPRLLDQQHISENPLMSMPPRLLDHTIISKSTDDSRPQLSNVIGFKILQSHYSVLVRSMPDDYMNTVSQLERHLTGDHIGSILECTDVFTANQRILDCLIEQVNTKEGLLDFCEQLNSITSAPALTSVIQNVKRDCIKLITSNSDIPSTTNAVTTITATTTTTTATLTTINATVTTASVMTSSSVSGATKSQDSEDSSRSHYSVLVRSMPDDYMNTVSQLERHLTGDHIGSILECTGVFTANQRILDCLIDQINTKEGLLDFCNWLSTITNVPELTAALKELRKDIIAVLKADNSNSSTASNFNANTFIHYNKPPGVISINPVCKLSDVFIDARLSQFGPQGVATLKKHYNNLLMNLPEDHLITLQRLSDNNIFELKDTFVDQIISSENSQWPNQIMFNLLISSTENDNQLLGLSYLIERLATGGLLISDCPIIESFRKDCLQIIMEKVSKQNITTTTSVTTTSATTTDICTTIATTATTITTGCVSSISKQQDKDQPINNMRLLYKLIIPKISAHWDVVLANLEYDLAFKQELDRKYRGDPRLCCAALLEDWISSDKGVSPKTFTKLLEVLCTVDDIAPFMRDIIDGLKKEGIAIGDHITPPVSQVLPAAGKMLRFQSLPTCPANYIPRVQLLKEISTAILKSKTTPTIGTTVTIRGIGGIGKSTIAKALCHDPLIKDHFVDGFLWISLTPPIPNPVTMLSEIYQRLTGKLATICASESILKSEMKYLFSTSSCKLLVILDDVWEAKDAMIFVNVFSSCKIILTTRKMNINALIPPKMCFDIQSMSITQAVNLLALQIIEVETLHANDTNRIQELAKDLHCWPLLLNLVHGQLYFHCKEWNKSHQDAIIEVQQRLLDNGLTAFDPESELETSRENAVRASMTATFELLDEGDKTLLYYIASSIIGFGVYTFKDLLYSALKIDLKKFDHHIKNLWCHGLIHFQDEMLPTKAIKISCFGMHEVIGHYINENMPDHFYSQAAEIVAVFKNNFFNQYCSFKVDTTNVGQKFLSWIYNFMIPFDIRLSILFMKSTQAIIFNKLVAQKIYLDNFINSIQFSPLKNIHKIIKEDCKAIHSLLSESKYNEAIIWAKQYLKNHPLQIFFEKVLSKLNILLDSSSNFNYSVIKNYEVKYYRNCDGLRTELLFHIIRYNDVFCLVNAAASDDDVRHYLTCTLYTCVTKHT